MGESDYKSVNSLDPESFIRFLEIAYSLRKAMSRGQMPEPEQFKDIAPLLKHLLEYLIKNINKPSLDHTLIPFLEKILGLKLRKKKERDEDELEEEQEEKLTEEERARRHRLAVYEMHKIICPRRLAGESALENFISNVQTRGIDVALQNDGKEYAPEFNKTDLENLESYKAMALQSLKDAGTKGFGRGT